MGFTSKTNVLIVCGGFVGPTISARRYTDKCYFIKLDDEARHSFIVLQYAKNVLLMRSLDELE